MAEQASISLVTHVSLIQDPRVVGRVQYRLTDLIVMAVCAVIAEADTWVDVAAWCTEHLAWLRERLHLSVTQAPAHDTFGRVFSLLDAASVQAAFQGWLAAVTQLEGGEVVAIDGKALRHSFDTWHELPMLQVVNAWACSQHVMLAQVPVAPSSNEITAVPALLEQLVLGGCIITLDALHTHAPLAEQIVSQGADYVFVVKDNQPQLAADLASLFAAADQGALPDSALSYYHTVEKGHGRRDTRHCWAMTASQFLRYLDPTGRWPKLSSLVRVRREYILKGEQHVHERFFIASLPADARRLLEVVRAHWQVENQLHWVLDVVFDEDDARIRIGQAAQNFALLRRFALSLIQRDLSKGSIRLKRKKAAWNRDFLLSLIQF